jgi:hypothetical protein
MNERSGHYGRKDVGYIFRIDENFFLWILKKAMNNKMKKQIDSTSPQFKKHKTFASTTPLRHLPENLQRK